MLERSERIPWYTDLRLVFAALGGCQREFDWLLTDLEFIHLGASTGESRPPLSAEPTWLTGAELTRLVEAFEIQFVWGVLSGFRSGARLDLGALEVYPIADGNPTFWSAHPAIQHPAAQVEIVCWDSTATLLLCRDDGLSRQFRSHFPEAVDLDNFNQRRTA